VKSGLETRRKAVSRRVLRAYVLEQKMSIVKFEAVEDNILTIRGVQVILDSDVAGLYGVETREVNKAVKNNPDKFPSRSIWQRLM
jgi:hypothetical protein